MTWKIKNKNNYKARISYKVWNPVTGTEPPIFSSADVAKNSYIVLSDFDDEKVLSYKYYASGLNPVTNSIIKSTATVSGFQVNPDYNIYGTFDFKIDQSSNYCTSAVVNLYTNSGYSNKTYWTVLYPSGSSYDGQTSIIDSQYITPVDNKLYATIDCNINKTILEKSGVGIKFFTSNLQSINKYLMLCTYTKLPYLSYSPNNISSTIYYVGSSIPVSINGSNASNFLIQYDKDYFSVSTNNNVFTIDCLQSCVKNIVLVSNEMKYSTTSISITVTPCTLISTLWTMNEHGIYTANKTNGGYNYNRIPTSSDAVTDIYNQYSSTTANYVFDKASVTKDSTTNGRYNGNVYYGLYQYGIYIYTSENGGQTESDCTYNHFVLYCTKGTPTLDNIQYFLKNTDTELNWDNYSSYLSPSNITTTTSLSSKGKAYMYFANKYYIKGINSCRVSPTHTITQDFTIVSQGTPTVVSADKSIATATIYNLGSYYKLSVTGVSTGDVALTISATGCKDKTVNVHCKDINDPTITWSSEVESMYGVDTLYIYATISNPNDFSVKLYLENSSSAATTMSANSSYKVTIWQNDPREDHSNVTCSARLEDSGGSSHLVSSTYNNE